MTFPFGVYRPGSGNLLLQLNRTIESKRNLLRKAPTGIGKQSQRLFPSLKAMGQGLTSNILPDCEDHCTKCAEEYNFLHAKSANSSEIGDAYSKDKICFMEKTVCNPAYVNVPEDIMTG
jgi:DNA excision repair protein ERCC-2